MQLPVYFYFLIITFIAGITVYFQHPSPLYLKLFPAFLLVSIFVEFYAAWLAFHTGSNTVLYNFNTIIQFSFYLFVLKEVISSKQVKKWMLCLIGIFVLLSAINITFIQKKNWNSITYSFGCLLGAAFIIYYFYELFKLPKSTDLKKEPAFWICSGLLFYICCSFPLFGLVNLMLNAPPVIVRNMEVIANLVYISLYLLFIIAFLCRIKFQPISAPSIKKHTD